MARTQLDVDLVEHGSIIADRDSRHQDAVGAVGNEHASIERAVQHPRAEAVGDVEIGEAHPTGTARSNRECDVHRAFAILRNEEVESVDQRLPFDNDWVLQPTRAGVLICAIIADIDPHRTRIAFLIMQSE